MRKIIVYADQGVDRESLNHLIFSFQQMLGPSCIAVQKMDAKSLIEEPWEQEASLLVFPGGRDIFYHRLLDGKGTDKIRSFVHKGGRYLGICAGAYFGCQTIEFEKGGSLEVTASRSLGFFPGVAVGPAYGLGKFSYESLRGAEAAKISWKHKEYSVYFNGGCTFVPAGAVPEVKIMSHYLDLQGHPPAMLEIKVGKGLAFLSGVHFEYSTHFLSGQDQSVLAHLYPLLSQAEIKRQLLFKEILNRLGVSG